MPRRDQSIEARLDPAPLGAFLRSRRERLTPALVGLPALGRRRARGLRREEVAQLAGMSAAWYTYLEQGRDVRPSRETLEALTRALRLDPAERAYLFQLAYGPRAGADRRAMPEAPNHARVRDTLPGVPRPVAPNEVPPSIRRLLDALGAAPALVIDRAWDVVDTNAALRVVLPAVRAEPPAPHTPLNLVEYVLTSAGMRAALGDWPRVARMAVDGLRASLADVVAGDPVGARAAAVVAQLTAVSPEFRAWWPAHGLWTADRPVTHVYEHPRAGRLAFDGTMLDVRSTPGLVLLTYVPSDPESARRVGQLMHGVLDDSPNR